MNRSKRQLTSLLLTLAMIVTVIPGVRGDGIQ